MVATTAFHNDEWITMTIPEALRTRIEDNRAQREQTLERIFDILSETNGEGVSANEIADAIERDRTSTGNYLPILIERGLLFSREETQREREARFGGSMRAQRAQLYSLVEGVPERVTREVIPGVICEANYSEPTTRDVSLSQRIAAGMSTSRFRPVHDIAKRTGVAKGSIYSALVYFEARGDVVTTMRKISGGGAREYKHYRLQPTSPFAALPETLKRPEPEQEPLEFEQATDDEVAMIENELTIDEPTASTSLDEAGELFKTYVTALIAEATAELRSENDELRSQLEAAQAELERYAELKRAIDSVRR